ncbi:MAG: hypothetical protein V4618_03510 [Pseudomonadota bacterium]
MATDNQGSGSTAGNAFESARKAFTDTAASFTDQAGSRARDYATQGKDRAVDALDNVASLVGDAASQVSNKLGDQYGGYIQQAADAVSGFATTLRDKDAEELIGDARNAVRSSPAIAIAAAAAVGFLMARVIKSGLTPKAEAGMSGTAAKPRAPRQPAAPKSAAAKPAAKTAPKKTASAAQKPTAAASAPKAPLADAPISTTPAPDSTSPAG